MEEDVVGKDGERRRAIGNKRRQKIMQEGRLEDEYLTVNNEQNTEEKGSKDGRGKHAGFTACLP